MSFFHSESCRLQHLMSPKPDESDGQQVSDSFGLFRRNMCLDKRLSPEKLRHTGGNNMQSIKELIALCKDGDENSFLELTGRFRPLINRHVRQLYKDDAEDTRQEMLLALWEAVNNIAQTDNEAGCIKYLINALSNRFYELYRKSRRINDHYVFSGDDVLQNKPSEDHLAFQNIETYCDLQAFIYRQHMPAIRICESIINEHLSDTQISVRFNVSRQYANRIRRTLRKKLSDDYFGGII